MTTPANALNIDTSGAVSFNGSAFTGGILSGADGGTGVNNIGLTIDLHTAPGLNKVLTSDLSGNAAWQTPSGGGITTVSVVTFDITGSPHTYTVPGNLAYAEVEIVAGGGGSGGALAGVGVGWGGAAGGYSFGIFDAATLGATVTVTIGDGGTAGTSGNGAGGTGATTTFGSLLTALGGNGGSGFSVSVVNLAVGGSASGGTINIQGGFATPPISQAGLGHSGGGGSSFFGFGGAPVPSDGTSGNFSGISGTGYGSGSSGASSFSPGGGAVAGTAGQPGLCKIIEYLT